MIYFQNRWYSCNTRRLKSKADGFATTQDVKYYNRRALYKTERIYDGVSATQENLNYLNLDKIQDRVPPLAANSPMLTLPIQACCAGCRRRPFPMQPPQ